MLPRSITPSALRRRGVAAVVTLLIALLSGWVALRVTPPASVSLGIVDAQISAAPGTGAVVRTALGRPVTDDTLNNGPLQVHVAIAVDRTRPTTEPQVLAALQGARPRVLHAAVGYLLRLAGLALLLAVILSLAVFRRAWRRLIVVASTTAGLLCAGVVATAATTRFAGFDAASCAHGWSRYAIADLPELTPPAPTVTPPVELASASASGLIPVVLISDAHLNPEGLSFALALQTATHARAVLDAGDTTSYGVPGEACVVAPLIRSFHVPYVWVRGNHDSLDFARTMRSMPRVRVLDGNETTVAGITVFGVGDPSFTPHQSRSRRAMLAAAAAVRATIADRMEQAGAVTPDVVLVHDCRMAESTDPTTPGVAGIAPLVACGHLHRYAEATVLGSVVLHTGTVGAGGLNAFSVGRLQDFDAQVLLFSSTTPHRLVRYYDVDGAGGAAARFTEHDPVAPLPSVSSGLTRSGM